MMVFPFTVPLDGSGRMLDAAQGVYARSLARTLVERLSEPPRLQANLAQLTADGPLDGENGLRGHVADPRRSFEPYLEAMRLDPRFADAQERLLALALDFALGGQGPVSAAREACEKLLAIDSSAFKAQLALAEMDLAEGKPTAAAERISRALALQPEWPPAYERIGTALLRPSRAPASVPWFEKALAARGDDTDALQG